MKYFSHLAVLLTVLVGNTAMWGQISRTVSFDLNSRHERDYCLGANTNEFTLTIDTKLENIDSLQAYDIFIRFDEKKIKLVAGLRIGTISSQIPQSNFFFGMDTIGVAKVYGYLNYKAGNLVGEGALIALRGEWLQSQCPDSTICRIEFFDPGFEFGIGPRFVKIDSSVKIYNRVNDTVNTKVTINSPTVLEDSLDHGDSISPFVVKSEFVLGKGTANDTVTIQCIKSDSLNLYQIQIDSVREVNATVIGENIVITKPNRAVAGYVSARYTGAVFTKDTMAVRNMTLSTKASACDCSRSIDSKVTAVQVYRRSKPDTITGINEEELLDQCTEYYDILGRFIETDCPKSESAKAIRRKAFKLGNDYIQYIDSK